MELCIYWYIVSMIVQNSQSACFVVIFVSLIWKTISTSMGKINYNLSLKLGLMTLFPNAAFLLKAVHWFCFIVSPQLSKFVTHWYDALIAQLKYCAFQKTHYRANGDLKRQHAGSVQETRWSLHHWVRCLHILPSRSFWVIKREDY